MRPPSYYTSLANSNSAANRNSNSSQQLRSSFSSSSSSAYITRTHLPFVAQSALVAHCITGAGSTTRPYGHKSTSYSRPVSTRRHENPYLVASSTKSHLNNSYSASRSLLNPISSYSRPPTTTTTSYSRPSTLSTYYKPIRLRERPTLTQLARPTNSYSTNSSSYTHNQNHSGYQPRPSSGDSKREKEVDKDKGGERDTDWSSDVARNISRNKYLIKFREFDKRSSISPIPPETPQDQVDQNDISNQELSSQAEQLVEVATEESMRLIETRENLPVDDNRQITANISVSGGERQSIKTNATNRKLVDDCDKSRPVDGDSEAVEKGKKKVLKERRNIKLKIKAVNEKASERSTKTITSTTVESTGETSDSKVKPIVDAESSTIKTKVKKLVKVAKKLGQLEQPDPENQKQLVEEPRKALSIRQASENAPEKKEESKPTEGPSKRIRFRQYSYDDFNFLSVLGHGGWGFVILAELKEHDACFAVKCIKKITIVEDDDFDSIMIERKVLTLGNVHPFICKLFCTFETPGYLFFVMEYCAGGDLMFHVQREGKFSESRCRFYAAEIICAIRFLHNQHIIYRDLKLDNILLDSKGHIRLVDFGMCQCRTYREEMLPSNFCGTPEYISPEIIKGVPYNHSVDWWSFGVLLYEMAVGKMPFRGGDENELLWNVCYEQIHYPMFLTKELTSLLQLLLEREPTKRMGMATCKAGDIHDQAWFRGLDWRAFEEMRVEPPFVPQVDSRRDVQNFDADFTQSTPELSPVTKSTLDKIDQEQFRKFPYTNPMIFNFD